MAELTKIEWANSTVNCWWGCTKVHEGCDNCYAETWSNRFHINLWGNDSPRKEIKTWANDLVRYNRKAAAANEIHRVFVGSMMDIFEKPMPVIDYKLGNLQYNTGDIRKKLLEEIVPITPNLLYLFLTKRPSNINKYIPESWKKNPPSNVMFGTSPVNQETADKLIPQLLEVNGKRFLSIEPQLGEINLKQSYLPKGRLFGDDKEWWLRGIDWVIVGGESGHSRRPFNHDWARLIKQQCEGMNVPFFMKQIDKVIPVPDDLLIRQFPK